MFVEIFNKIKNFNLVENFISGILNTWKIELWKIALYTNFLIGTIKYIN